MRLLWYEFVEVGGRPLLWVGGILFCFFILYGVEHLDVEDRTVKVMLYRTPVDDDAAIQTIADAESMLLETADISTGKKIDQPVADIADEMLRDGAAIGVTRTAGGWRLTVKARSSLEHKKLVRIAQLLGVSLSLKEPWFLPLYGALGKISQTKDSGQSSSGDSDEWPRTVQISGLTADPGPQSRVFVPKTIVVLVCFLAFGFACRSMIREISNNTLPFLLVSSKTRWWLMTVTKAAAASLIGTTALWSLLLFATHAAGFQIKGGLPSITIVLTAAIAASALLGVACGLIGRTVARIYLLGSAYLVALILLSGLIAPIDENSIVLRWLSTLFPVSPAMDMLSDWMFYGLQPVLGGKETNASIAILILSAIITVGAVMYRKSQN